jgi:hypothetical protein
MKQRIASVEGGIPVYSPGIKWYADEIRANRPFSFVRYGEGEWRFIVPALPEKRGKDSFWKLKEAQDSLRHTVLKCHHAKRYFPALFHQRHLASRGWLRPMMDWLAYHELDWIEWYDARVWRTATEHDQMHVIVAAIRESKLPVVVVGPKCIQDTVGKLGAIKFIQVHPTQAYWNIAEIEKQILAIKQPALFSFSVGCNTKMMIHSLWPKIGAHSFMIDFGASWEGLCGGKTRPYHHSLTHHRIRKNWEGK